MNVLVFPCGSEIGLEIHAALAWQKDITLFGVSSVADHGEFTYRNYRKINEHVHAVDFIDQLNKLVDEWGIDIIMPAHDSVFLRLSEAQAAQQLLAHAAVPALEQARICRNKNSTYAFFADCDFVPRSLSLADASYPIFAKPAVSQGSLGAEIVHNAGRHQELLDATTEYVFSEYLPGLELTVDCLSDGNGLLRNVAPRERCRVKSGISVRTRPFNADASIIRISEQIAQRLQLKGAWFFQLRQDTHGQWKLLEIAPRIAGSMGLSRHLGINYPLLSLYAYLQLPFSLLLQSYPIVMDRALRSRYRVTLEYDQVYLDLDDTLLHRGRVNPVLLVLLYQWAASGVQVHLITRHESCPYKTLAKHKIARELFSSVIHIVDGCLKSSHIPKGERALFIDDSFRERLDVSETLRVPVFDLDSIDQLIDWRE